MSIIRLSLLEEGLYAPEYNGALPDNLTQDFTLTKGKDRRGVGNMGLIERDTLPGAGQALHKYLAKSLDLEASALPADPNQGPLVILVHGWQFDPAKGYYTPPHHRKADNPHARLYHFEEHSEEIEMRHHSRSWPLGLDIQPEDNGAKGLAIGFGWDSAPGLFESLLEQGVNHYVAAYRRAERIGAWHLVAVIDALNRLLPGREIDILCHSLGSRVVVRALAQAADEDAPSKLAGRLADVIASVKRVILLAGAERVNEAQLMMRRLNRGMEDADRTGAVFPNIPAFYNVVSRENDVLDILAENFGEGGFGSKQVIGHNGLEALDPAWVDIQLDDPEVAAWFKERGYSVSGDNTTWITGVLDHWIHFTWRENMRVYRDILRDRDNWNIGDLKTPRGGILDRIRIMRDKSSGRANLRLPGRER